LTRDQFIHALELGLGRAILYARDHDVSEFKDVILDACLHCWAYDPQLDGTRAGYMLDLLDFVPDKASYCEQVLKSLAGGDDYDTVQRFHFARCLALDSDERARRAMYEGYKPGPRMAEHIGVEFIDLDGIDGFLFAAEKIGELMMAQPGEVDHGYLLSKSEDICGENETWNALRDAAARNPRIEAYLATVESNRRVWDQASKRTQEVLVGSYEQLLSSFPNASPGLPMGWGQKASDADIEKAARGLIAAKDVKEQLFHLRIFWRRIFPLDVEALLPFVEVERNRVGFYAVKALSHIAHPKVRELAFRLIDSHAALRSHSIELLARNYQPGDHDLVLGWFDAEDDEDQIHWLGMGLRDFCRQHPNGESEVRIWRAFYEKEPCTFCREGAVQRLIKLGALTDEMRVECAYDANYDIRELVKG
jgi:hypothetical protein